MCLTIITTTCQTAIQFERDDDCCYCCQITDYSYNMQSTREIITFQGGSIILHLNLEEALRGDRKKCEYSNSELVFDIRMKYEYSNIRTFVDILMANI